MERVEFILVLIIFVLVLYMLLQKRIMELKIKRGMKREADLVDTLKEQKLRDDLDLEKDRDLVLVDEYTIFISDVINKYNNSRSKRIAYKTRQALLYKTIEILPIFCKYIDVFYTYDPDVDPFEGKTDKEVMMALESAYNDFTHDNLESFNTILPIVVRLRDEK